MIDFRLLRHVLALGEHRNFVRAAESLHLSQPALSRSIAGLEEELGVLLFDRMPSGLQPTLYGQIIIDRGQEILDRENELRREIQLAQGIEVGELSIGAGPFPFEISVCNAVAKLIVQYPNLQVRIDKDSPPAIVEHVLNGGVDLGVVDIRHCQDDARLSIELLPMHTIACCCRRGHPLAGKNSLALAEILAYPLVGTVMPAALGPLLSSGSAAGRIDPENKSFLPAITVDSLSAARRIAQGCDALLPIALSCIESELASGDLVILDFMAPWMRNQYGFISKRDRTLSPAATEFMAKVREVEGATLELETRLFATHARFTKPDAIDS
jgi:DNA-binding transcriptional LysR family regulator